MSKEEGFINDSIKTLAIAFVICLFILILATWNIIAPLFVITCVFVIMTTIGFIIVQLDW